MAPPLPNVVSNVCKKCVYKSQPAITYVKCENILHIECPKITTDDHNRIQKCLPSSSPFVIVTKFDAMFKVHCGTVDAQLKPLGENFNACIPHIEDTVPNNAMDSFKKFSLSEAANNIVTKRFHGLTSLFRVCLLHWKT